LGNNTKQQSRNDSGKQEAQDTKGQDQVNEQSSGPCSFVLGTLVAMDGRFEAIEDISVGDLVVSRDDETWEDGTQPVNATFGEHHESVLQITYVIESDWFQFNKQVVTTAEHPFMVASVGWTPAAEMYVGDRIVTLDNEFARIVAIEEKSEPQYAYNFEVDEFNTYAVTEDLLWVHNSCGDTDGPVVGGGASLDNLSPSDAKRIQNAADRTGQDISVVGSRARGDANLESDWDYVMSGKSSQRHSASSSVPRGTSGGAINASNRETGIDVSQSYNPDAPDFSPVRPDEPHITFKPKK
jgi:hypothetical protein